MVMDESFPNKDVKDICNLTNTSFMNGTIVKDGQSINNNSSFFNDYYCFKDKSKGNLSNLNIPILNANLRTTNTTITNYRSNSTHNKTTTNNTTKCAGKEPIEC